MKRIVFNGVEYEMCEEIHQGILFLYKRCGDHLKTKNQLHIYAIKGELLDGREHSEPTDFDGLSVIPQASRFAEMTDACPTLMYEYQAVLLQLSFENHTRTCNFAVLVRVGELHSRWITDIDDPSWFLLKMHANPVPLVGMTLNEIENLPVPPRTSPIAQFLYLAKFDKDGKLIDVGQAYPPPRFRVVANEVCLKPSPAGANALVVKKGGSWNRYPLVGSQLKLPDVEAIAWQTDRGSSIPAKIGERVQNGFKALFDGELYTCGHQIKFTHGQILDLNWGQAYSIDFAEEL